MSSAKSTSGMSTSSSEDANGSSLAATIAGERMAKLASNASSLTSSHMLRAVLAPHC